MNLQPKLVVPVAPLTELPLLPEVISYYDDFRDCYRQVVGPSSSNEWTISFDGRRAGLDFSGFDGDLRELAKSWCADVLACLSPVTATKYLLGLRRVSAERLMQLVTSEPHNMRSFWKVVQGNSLPYESLVSLKSLMSFLCRLRIGAWSPDWIELVSQLPLPKLDKYAGVRTGEVFLDVEQEAGIVQHIDQVCRLVSRDSGSVGDQLLEETCILVCSYQFAFRPKQIAMLEMRNIRIWNDSEDKAPAVHLTFTMIKQRSAKRVLPMVRRVKSDWAPLFVELYRRAEAKGLCGSDHVFRRTPHDIEGIIADATERIVGQRRYATELRHTAAQRMADAGASEEELAEFLGHTDLDTPLIYFRTSPSQAQRVNRALGISETYQRVAKIAREGFISSQQLATLKGDQQIAGVPHGIPIAGIGGCAVGQPSCPHNPIMSCYGCRKFLPVTEVAIHKQVLADLRGIVKFYYSASRGEPASPGLQLERTISDVQTVIDELGGQNLELKS